MEEVQHSILILSGKGGVGKSTTTVQLAVALWRLGLRVAILDADLCGPSIPRLLGAGLPTVSVGADRRWQPVSVTGDGRLVAISLSYLVSDPDAAVMWRGPKKTQLVQQFVAQVAWGARDVLLVDTPPGTSDEHLAVLEALLASHRPPDGAVLVTTPQAVAVADVLREAEFCRRVGLPLLGVVENMSGFRCPCCGDVTNIFAAGGGERLAERLQAPFLGHVPIDPAVAADAERADELRDRGYEGLFVPQGIAQLAASFAPSL